MIPLLAIPAAASFLGRVFGPRAAESPAPNKAGQTDFAKNLNSELSRSNPANPFDQTALIHSMIARQQNGVGLTMIEKMNLAQMVQNKTVQVVDPSGNNVVGVVGRVGIFHGEPHLLVEGQAYPLSSLQAVLPGIRRGY